MKSVTIPQPWAGVIAAGRMELVNVQGNYGYKGFCAIVAGHESVAPRSRIDYGLTNPYYPEPKLSEVYRAIVAVVKLGTYSRVEDVDVAVPATGGKWYAACEVVAILDDALPYRPGPWGRLTDVKPATVDEMRALALTPQRWRERHATRTDGTTRPGRDGWTGD